MGERAAYKVGDIYIRKQWYAGCTKRDIRDIVLSIAEELMESRLDRDEKPEINAGGVALRHDLSEGRVARAMISALSTPPFDSVYSETPHDISNHGIFEIELDNGKWNEWRINHIPVEWNSGDGEEVKEEEKETVAIARFEKGETLPEGLELEWVLDEDSVMEFRYE